MIKHHVPEEEFNLYRPMGGMSHGSSTDSNERGLNHTDALHTDHIPHDSPPQPMTYEPGCQIENLSFIEKSSCAGELMGDEVRSETSEQHEVLIGPPFTASGEPTQDKKDTVALEDKNTKFQIMGKGSLGGHVVESHRRPTVPSKHTINVGSSKSRDVDRPRPTVHCHFHQRQKQYPLAQRRYTAPPNQSGLQLQSVMGYNGNGRGNMVWNPDIGFFAYTIGCIVIVEDLNAGTQQHLMGHAEEISTLALQNDCQILASASGALNLSPSQICLWDLESMTCKKVLTHHEYDIVGLAYSRDDRFLVSIGDYRECCLAIWSTNSLELIVATRTELPVFDMKWDPSTVNEFATVGENGTVMFWLLDETGSEANLNVHEADVPEELLQTNHMGNRQVDFTVLEYGGDSTMYVGANNGKVSAWDTRRNTCFMHWEADKHEIDVLISKGGRLVTGSTGRGLRMWSVVGIPELRLPGESNTMRQGGLTMEDEMNLDGPVTVAAFDDTMDMGIVGTSSGTLWYLNWTERTSIRLVSGHNEKVNDLVLCDDRYLASCSDDGSLRIWSVKEREQTLQFQVMDQACNCIAFSPTWPQRSSSITTISNTDATPVMAHTTRDEGLRLPNIVGGYSDGTVRMFDLNKVEMVLKMHPHAVAVTAICFSADGRMILSGGSDGLVAVSSPTTGMTVRVINDHKGAPVNKIDVTLSTDLDVGVQAPLLWLICSADRRVSVWSADWSKDTCELVDWLTFPAPAFTPDGDVLSQDDPSYYQRVPPSLAQFSTEEPDIVLYTGYGMQKQVQFYSMMHRKVLRNIALTHWAREIHMSPGAPILGVATNERLLKLMDYNEGSFQDFVGHSDSVQLVRFSPDGRQLFTASHSEIFVWDVLV